MTKKIPPPPKLAQDNQGLNRWLLELTSILNSSGDIDPSTIAGFIALALQVQQNTASIAANTASIAANTASIAANAASITALQAAVTALQALPQVRNGVVDPASGLGVVGDWYANTAGAAGHRIFVKTGVATWTAFAF